MSPTESELRSFLHHEAEQIDASGDHAGAVFAAKRRSDRRRAGCVAGLAVIALVAPLAWSSFAGHPSLVPATSETSTAPSGTVSTSAPVTTAPATTSPTPAPTVTALLKDAQVTASPTLSDTFSDEDPGVPYSASGVFHDGPKTATGPLKGGYQTFARLDHGGYVVRATWGSDQKVYIVSADGAAKVLAGAQSFVVSADRSRIAWTDGRAVNSPGTGLVHIADSRGVELSTVQVDGLPMALVGDVLFAIKLAGYDFAGESVRVDLTSGAVTPIQGNVYAVHGPTGLAISADTLPPETIPGKPQSCYRLIDVTTTSPVTRLRACGDFLPDRFSPDGRYIIGRGVEERIVVVDTSSGRVVLDAIGESGLHPEAARMTDDGQAIVMSVTKDWTRNGLVRCELTGKCAQVGGPALKDPAAEDTVSPRTAYGVSEN